ncbi:T9SS type A sorting domain-containing protein, partial [bacterium]|nr:T9SS type A sorting domain-containing protein [bacterium]
RETTSGSKLGQNFPNPFNPETWIPYSLSQGSNVKIKIYNVVGQLLRTLDLGYKTAGDYLSRNAAAYWDGNNSGGEEMASGVYFYRLETDSFTSTKRMVILK